MFYLGAVFCRPSFISTIMTLQEFIDIWKNQGEDAGRNAAAQWAQEFSDKNIESDKKQRDNKDVEDVPYAWNFGTSDTDIANEFDQIAKNTGNTQYFHEMQAALMQWLQTLNERKYNEGQIADERAFQIGQLADQRRYEDPQAQLARLMATGMSREAALQAISAGVSGGSIPGTSPIASPSPAVSSSADDSAQFANYMSGVQSLVGSLEGLANVTVAGLSLPQVLQQNAISKNTAFASNMQQQATNDVGQFVQALYARGADGNYLSAPSQQDSVSLESLMKFAGSVPKVQNPQLHKFMNSPQYSSMIGNPFATNMLSSQFRGMSDAQCNQLDDDVISQSRLLQLQEKINGVNLSDLALKYKWDESKFSDYNLTHNVISQFELMEFQDKIDILKASRTPEQLKYRISKLQNDNQFQAVASAILLQKEQFLSDSYQFTPEARGMANMCYFLDQCGFSGLVGETVKAVGATSGFLTGAFEENGGLSKLADQLERTFKPNSNTLTNNLFADFLKVMCIHFKPIHKNDGTTLFGGSW